MNDKWNHLEWIQFKIPVCRLRLPLTVSLEHSSSQTISFQCLSHQYFCQCTSISVQHWKKRDNFFFFLSALTMVHVLWSVSKSSYYITKVHYIIWFRTYHFEYPTKWNVNPLALQRFHFIICSIQAIPYSESPKLHYFFLTHSKAMCSFIF